MSKQISPEMRRKLETIKSLKQEYCVNSENAFYYTQAMSCYEDLCEKIRKDPAIAFQPSLKEMSFLYNAIGCCAQSWLKLTSVRHSTTDNFGIEAHHFVFAWSDRVGYQLTYGNGDHVWHIDILMVLKRILPHAIALPSKADLMQFFIENAEEMNCFIVKETGQRLSGSDIIASPDFRNGNPEGFLGGTVPSVIDNWPLPEDELAELQQAYDDRDIEKCHEIMKQLEAGDQAEMIMYWIRQEDFGLFLQPSDEEQNFLLNFSKLMNRAEREYTLGHYEIERKVALSFVYGFTKYGFNFDSTSDMIEKAIRYQSDTMRRNKERFEHMESLHAPSTILENGEKLWRQARYLYLSLYQNRRWLEKYFSS